MPPAKNSTSRSSTFKEPAALKWLSSSLDTAQQALVELREDTGRDVSQGARDLHKDLRAFISSARRDAGKLAKALQRDFDQAQKQLAQGTGTAGEARVTNADFRAARSALLFGVCEVEAAVAPPGHGCVGEVGCAEDG